ncbi:MAG: hypothetical protein R3C01_01590 [Planctomycetaceae bacterium]
MSTSPISLHSTPRQIATVSLLVLMCLAIVPAFLIADDVATPADSSATESDSAATTSVDEPIVPPKSLLDAPKKPRSIAICGDCMKEIDGDAKKCPHCGVELTDAYVPPAELLAPAVLTNDGSTGSGGSSVINSDSPENSQGGSTVPRAQIANQQQVPGTTGYTAPAEEGSGNAILDFLKSFKGITLMTGLCMLFFFWKLNS